MAAAVVVGDALPMLLASIVPTRVSRRVTAVKICCKTAPSPAPPSVVTVWTPLVPAVPDVAAAAGARIPPKPLARLASAIAALLALSSGTAMSTGKLIVSWRLLCYAPEISASFWFLPFPSFGSCR
ncbi:hypothetical protein PF005_g22321 [Phytophthora fragariae]|uniref:Uncharacterized protein n=4 Tax=Phytophthora TaxID=4783 RepID=A0A6A3WCY9_9STRA|nr:hypothetical protein PF005_g22321 [Phytophthora fragariae]KAE9286717.1 hypothetical protein PF001_g21312 [Phytophthora fragariae]